jgi:L-ribulose-5-phosphate 4-epimerase
MSRETELREKLATCTRIMAMQGLVGLFGHVSAYDPDTKRFYLCPGAGSDKATTRPEDLFVLELDGTVLEGEGQLAIEWPIHAAVHAGRPDALAVAHLHAPYSTLFAIARTEFSPVTLNGMMFRDGLPLYTKPKMVMNAEDGKALADQLGTHRAILMRGHGSTVAAASVEEMLYASLVLEDNTRNAVLAATLGELSTFSPDEAGTFWHPSMIESGSKLAWEYFTRQEARWDRQPGTSNNPLG